MRAINREHDSDEQRYYSDAVEAGGLLFVSGCVPYDDGGDIVGVGDPERQFAVTLDNLEKTLATAGYGWEDVAKLTIYLTDIGDIPATLAPRRERFGDSIRPATTLVEVSGLLSPDVACEVDAIAVKRDASDRLRSDR